MLERFAGRFADKLIAVSEPLKHWGLSLGIGRIDKYITIYDGIEIDRFKIDFDVERKRQEFGITRPYNMALKRTIAHMIPFQLKPF